MKARAPKMGAWLFPRGAQFWFNSVLVCAVATGLLAGCASQPIILPAVGPQNLATDYGRHGEGRLQVFTETDEFEVSQDVPYFPHRDYWIYSADQKRIKRVWNSENHEDETPTIVSLPAGSYEIRADAEFYGPVRVPVVIRANRLTKVVLQPGYMPGLNVADSDLVRMPDGYVVGWRALEP